VELNVKMMMMMLTQVEFVSLIWEMKELDTPCLTSMFCSKCCRRKRWSWLHGM